MTEHWEHLCTIAANYRAQDFSDNDTETIAWAVNEINTLRNECIRWRQAHRQDTADLFAT